MNLDKWQEDVLTAQGNICLRSGRQVGKSTVISIKAAQFAIRHPKKSVLIIASVERQASLLFDKLLDYLLTNFREKIKGGKDRPTKHKIELKNGSIIYCLPTGESGYGIRGYTIDLLIADEAAFIPEAVWTAVTPMLAATGGQIILLSTPFGREGYFARCFTDQAYTKFHISSEDCPRISKDFLAHEKATMTRMQYQQEYLGEFVDEIMQFFKDELIQKCQLLKRAGTEQNKDYFLGVDVARLGGDETTFEIIDRTDRNMLKQVENITRINNLITDTTREILALERQWHFRKIYIDDGGLGVGVFDALLEREETRRKTIPINNARRSLDVEENPRKKRLLKEDLYNNLLNLMELGQIQLLDDPEIFQSLKSIQMEYSDDGTLKIYGRYSHIAEGLIRACWSVRDKGLNIWIC
jgi:hypothetical protein